ncbi:hypothetical protein ABT040_27860 [Streptomyces sp. NPDC002688]|uniref:hypothetical protein n=1 Tax=Streptomyces sp. NPDC002688 TaxID=3154423 RepID=UPI00332035E5
MDRRRTMWALDTVRGTPAACLVLAVGLGPASVGLLIALIALAFTLITLRTPFDSASTALLPAPVDRAALGGADARLMSGRKPAGGLLASPVLLLGLMNRVRNVNQVTLMQQRSPESMIGRVSPASRAASASGTRSVPCRAAPSRRSAG